MTGLEKEAHYTKRKGTTDQGIEYEQMSIIRLILQLITDKNTENFELSLNNNYFDDFDDIVLAVESKHKKEMYAIQIKQSSEAKVLCREKLTDGKNFKIEKYFNSYQKLKDTQLCNLILFTNNRTNNLEKSDNIILDVDSIDEAKKEKISVKIIKVISQFLVTIGEETNECYKLQVVTPKTNTEMAYQEFFNNFYLYTDQSRLTCLESKIRQKFETMFSCTKNEFGKLVLFVREWRRLVGKVPKLSKVWMQHLIALQILESSIKTLSFGQVNDHMKILREAISKSTVTGIDDGSYNTVMQLWGDCKSDNLLIYNKLRQRYKLSPGVFGNIADIDDLTLSKILWLKDESPLIVTESGTAYKVAEMCASKKFILVGRNKREYFKITDKIRKEFRCSLQGIKPEPLSFFIGLHKGFEDILTIDIFVKMLYNPYVVGIEETLPEPYISRRLTQNMIDLEYLTTCRNEDTLIVVDCNNKFFEVKKIFHRCNFVDIVDYLNNQSKDFLPHFKTDRDNFTIYKHDNQCCVHRFETLCKKNRGKRHYHHFEYLDGNLCWIRSRGEVDDLKNYRLKDITGIKEAEFWCAKSENNINLIVDDSGTGKTIILKSFKNNFPSYLWTVILTPQDIETLIDEGSPLEDFLFNVKYKNCNIFDQQVLKMYIDKNQIAYFWDALDEIPEKDLRLVTNLIKELADKSSIQWVTSRRHLKQHLETTFKVLSRKLLQLNNEDQKTYFESCLENKSEDVLQKLGTLLDQKDVLGNPLKIKMLTDLFRRDHQKYLELTQNRFSIVDLFGYFNQEQFNVFFEKTNVVKSRAKNNIQKPAVRNYEIASLKQLFPQEIFDNFNVSSDDFEDIVGLMVDKTHFIHNSWPEYFAAKYLSEHLELVPKLGDMFFLEKYSNVRFFWDLLLAEKPHLAALNKNFSVLETYGSTLANYEDRGGRLTLHLICSWMQRYPLLKIEETDNLTLIDDDVNSSLTQETAQNLEILDYILKRCNSSKEDKVFKMTAVQYAIKSECLIALLHLSLVQNLQIDDYVLTNLMYYSARLGYDKALHLYKPEHARLRTKTNKDSLLHLAINHQTFVSKLLGNEKHMISYRNKNGETPIFGAARNERSDILQLLIDAGADVDLCAKNNWIPIYVASRSGHLSNVELLTRVSVNINTQTHDGQTPLYIAAHNGYHSIVIFLIDVGASVNITTHDGWSPLNAACQNEHIVVVEVLLANGADVNIAAHDGPSPLLTASYRGYAEIVKRLLEAGANTEATMNEGWTSLKVACQNGHVEVVKLLIEHCANVNATTKYGWTALHAAAKNGHGDLVEILVQCGAMVDAVTTDGRRAVDVAANEGVARFLMRE